MGRPTGPHGAGRARLLEAATALFSEHGVNGTSLHMIADELGVTKAAVYHQFTSKSAIVLAVFSPAFETLTSIADAAEAAKSAARAYTITVEGLVDMALRNRQLSAALQRDPVAARLVRGSDEFRLLIARIDRLLIGDNPSSEARVALAAAGAGLMIAVADPSLEGIDAEIIHRVLLVSTKRVLSPYRAGVDRANARDRPAGAT